MKQTFTDYVTRTVRHNRSGSPLILLESQLREHPASRLSVFAAGPKVLLKARGERITLQSDGEERTWNQNPWAALKEVRSAYPGWYLGYLGYDLKNGVEKLVSDNPDPVGAPDLLFMQPHTLLILDHRTGKLSHVSADGGLAGGGTGSTVETGESGESGETGESGAFRGAPLHFTDMQPLTSAESYLKRIRQAQEAIREGEFYEINLSHMLRGSFDGHGFDLYRMMKEKGPVPFAAYLEWDDFSVCCASPERFLCKQGERILSQPIKGTAARMADPQEDEVMKEQLRNSEKERAENLMIVDLVRHDFSRITRPGTVRVPELFTLQSFRTVHQLVSSVEGVVRPGLDPVDLLKTCFPMGSMTGAPKIRTMQAIEELEDYRRGIYSGAIGYIRPDGDFDFNVVIRTAILKQNDLYYPVGGAITSDSDPQKELEETLVKTHALTTALDPAVHASGPARD